MVKIEANSYQGVGFRIVVGETPGVNFGVTTRVGLGVTVSGGVTGRAAFEGRGSLGYKTKSNVSGIKTKTIISQIKDKRWPKDKLLYTR
jgi:hypothetical protein